MATSAATSGSAATSKPTKVCVFCASFPGNNPAHLAAARSLAQAFARHNIHLVYGGGTKGMMGELASTLISLSGPESIQGIVPEALLKHEAHEPRASVQSISQAEVEAGAVIPPSLVAQWEDPVIKKAKPSRISLDPQFGFQIVVDSMHTRKDAMARLVNASGFGSGFVGLSGGFGTLEEVAEMTTWNQIGIHAKGIVLFNVEEYWNGLMQWVGKAVSQGYITAKNGGILVMREDAEGCVEALKQYQVSDDRLALKWEEK